LFFDVEEVTTENVFTGKGGEKGDISEIQFTKEEITFICSAINHYGSGQHPYIDENNYKYLTVSYVVSVLNKKKLINNLSEKASELRSSVINKIDK
jgi:hypothetical protein